MRDDDLRRQVAAEFSLDPRTATVAIDVSAAGGMITLRGCVPGLALKRAAGSAAARVHGVTGIANELRVQVPQADRRSDEDLRGDVLEALMLDVSVPMTVDARVQDGLVTLTGTAEWHYQRQAAEYRTAEVPGVAAIDNAVTLTQVPDSSAAREAVRAAVGRSAALRDSALSVETSSGGMVILTGTVSSWAAHNEAAAAAWSVPGVTRLDDRIRVESTV